LVGRETPPRRSDIGFNERGFWQLVLVPSRKAIKMEGDSYPNIEPDENHAQLVVPASWAKKEWEILEETVERAGSQILEIEAISSSWIRIRLRGPDMREVALRLTEKGVFQFRGMNALSVGKESG
jgi:glycine cleavage system aminomethyltransferase T